MVNDSGQVNWLLKFISGKYQGGEFPLEEGKEYIIGRSSETHMVLVEDMVSRQHAKIVVQDNVVMLVDLNSTNGSFVNGERVQQAVLKEGDRILFGTSIIKLMRASRQGPQDTFPPMSMDSLAPPAAAAAATQAPPGPRGATQAIRVQSAGGGNTMGGLMQGQIDEMPLPDLLQLLSAMRKNGQLRLHSESREAIIYLREGRIVFAELSGSPEIHPEKAAYRILTWTTGTFVLEPPTERQFEIELEYSTEALVMEAMRLFDEVENIRHKLPDLAAAITLKRPLVPALRGLTPELLDTLQLVINHGVVEAVLNHSGAPDLDTLQDIEYLLKNGYIEQSKR